MKQYQMPDEHEECTGKTRLVNHEPDYNWENQLDSDFPYPTSNFNEIFLQSESLFPLIDRKNDHSLSIPFENYSKKKEKTEDIQVGS
jgi:hypothetical protein